MLRGRGRALAQAASSAIQTGSSRRMGAPWAAKMVGMGTEAVMGHFPAGSMED
jgi:hypothetical protein